ncbi:unnamed protein product [Mesocestoides corti]|uniref:TPR_REGION domain-containing protein n=1 Tax=Mesocestoides corti TaxID=53468 RepID=A0A0R3UHY0_MESCO|nr:unnamed protein product [Mesocestoides corti]
MTHLAEVSSSDPLLDEIADDNEFIDSIDEEFYDACSLEETPKSDEFAPSVIQEEEPANGGIGSDETEDPLKHRIEYENNLSDEELEKNKNDAVLLKEDGNSKFKERAFGEALSLYTDALDKCPLKFSEERAKIFSNRAACHSHLGNRDAALTDCDEALKLSPDYVRCLLRRADLRETVDRLTEALEDYQHILKLDPYNAKAHAACAILPEKITAQQEKMKAEMMQQLKQLGNMVLKPFGLSTDNFKLTKDPNSGGYSVSFQQS